AAYEAAVAKAERLRNVSNEFHSKMPRPASDDLSAELSALDDAASEAWTVRAKACDALLECPAPDLPALQYKLALWTDDFDEDCAVDPDSDFGRVQWAVLKADMMRVAGDHGAADVLMGEANSIRSNTELLRAVSAAGGRLVYHGEHLGFALLWA